MTVRASHGHGDYLGRCMYGGEVERRWRHDDRRHTVRVSDATYCGEGEQQQASRQRAMTSLQFGHGPSSGMGPVAH